MVCQTNEAVANVLDRLTQSRFLIWRGGVSAGAFTPQEVQWLISTEFVGVRNVKFTSTRVSDVTAAGVVLSTFDKATISILSDPMIADTFESVIMDEASQIIGARMLAAV